MALILLLAFPYYSQSCLPNLHDLYIEFPTKLSPAPRACFFSVFPVVLLQPLPLNIACKFHIFCISPSTDCKYFHLKFIRQPFSYHTSTQVQIDLIFAPPCRYNDHVTKHSHVVTQSKVSFYLSCFRFYPTISPSKSPPSPSSHSFLPVDTFILKLSFSPSTHQSLF